MNFSLLQRAFALARREGLVVRVAGLGAWAGARLCSEFDPSARAISVDANTLSALRDAYGADDADAFHAAAIVHEISHARDLREGRGGTRADGEARAHAFVRETLGIDPSRSEALVRSLFASDGAVR